MYSIDINFLKNRQSETNKTLTSTTKAAPTVQEQLPMLIGLGIMVLLITFPLGLLMLLNWQTAQTKKSIELLNEQVAQLNAKNQKLTEMKKHIQAIDENTQSLVSVFNQVKPASAILQEIRNLIPPLVQVKSIKQNSSEQTQGQPVGTTTQITIDGYAINYDDVNKFVLTLQSSPFLKADATKLIKAELVPLPVNIENADTLSDKNLIIQFPEAVKYTIVTQLNDLPASQLLPALARNGSFGLVTRIKTLEQKGVLRP